MPPSQNSLSGVCTIRVFCIAGIPYCIAENLARENYGE